MVSDINEMGAKSMSANVYQAPFFVPPTVSTAYPGSVPSGQIVLYKDDSWTSTKLTIDTNSPQYPQGRSFSFSGTPLQDGATWIAFNLPTGTVCTLYDNVPTNNPSNPYNFSGLGVCVDLIGNGQTQTVNLPAYGANDKVSGGIWRRVKTSEGWFQLFADTNCSGTFTTFFMDEWPTTTWNSIGGWYLNDAASSINYPSLTPVQVLTLSQNADGTGQQVSFGAANPFGSVGKQAQANFTDSGMNDKISGFSYTVYQPVKATIDSVTTNFSAPISGGNTFNTSISGTNATSAEVQVQMQLAQSQTYSIATATSLQYSMSLSIGATVSATAGVPGVASVTASTTTTFTTGVTSTSTQTVTSSQTFQLQQTVTFTAPVHSTYTAAASVSVGTIPMTTVTTTGQFYYSQNLPGSTFDPVSQLYLLTSPVTVQLSGGVGTQVVFSASSTPA